MISIPLRVSQSGAYGLGVEWTMIDVYDFFAFVSLFPSEMRFVLFWLLF